MRPDNLQTRIFLDGGDPHETMEAIRLLGFLDGQTTNPTLIAKNPNARQRLAEGRKFSSGEILDFYRLLVRELYALIPQGSISVEVYADHTTTWEAMLHQGREMYSWIPNAHIKFPTSAAGLKAAEQAVKEGLRVNMTLCFSQEQAAAVYAATQGARPGSVYVSPFIGRLDDQGENGMALISNILRMYRQGDHHVQVLTASVRTIDHFLNALKMKSDIITAPFALLQEWAERGMPQPGSDYSYDPGPLQAIPYKEIDLNRGWREYDISHALTDKGMERFSQDWNALIS